MALGLPPKSQLVPRYGCVKETRGKGKGIIVKEKWCSFHVDKLLSASVLPDFFCPSVLVREVARNAAPTLGEIIFVEPRWVASRTKTLYK